MKAARLVGASVLLAVVLAGCATPPPPPVDTAKTTVTLLPDEEGNVGAITVTTPDGTRLVNKAYTTTTVDHDNKQPSEGVFVGQEGLTGSYKALIDAQPTKPKSFILYFALGSSELTAESRAMLPEVLKVARDRKPTEITIFGYADASGTEKRNEQLSAERARVIEAAMRKFDASLGKITVAYFGSKNPAIPTAGNVPEAKNRRAEIFIL
jgi:outer membrane protein OmpA-like peptidoglycan-associated protein